MGYSTRRRATEGLRLAMASWLGTTWPGSPWQGSFHTTFLKENLKTDYTAIAFGARMQGSILVVIAMQKG